MKAQRSLLPLVLSALLVCRPAWSSCSSNVLTASSPAAWTFAALFCPPLPDTSVASLVVQRQCDGTYTGSAHYFDSSQSSFNNNHQVVEVKNGSVGNSGQYNAVLSGQSGAGFYGWVHGDGTSGYSGANTTFGITSMTAVAGCGVTVTPPPLVAPSITQNNYFGSDNMIHVDVTANFAGGDTTSIIPVVQISAVTNNAGSPSSLVLQTDNFGGSTNFDSSDHSYHGSFTFSPSVVGVSTGAGANSNVGINVGIGTGAPGGTFTSGAGIQPSPPAGGTTTGSTSAGTTGASSTTTTGGMSSTDFVSNMDAHVVAWVVPDQAHIDTVQTALDALKTAGPFGLPGAINTALAAGSSTSTISTTLGDTYSVQIAGMSTATTLNTPWKDWRATGPLAGSITLRTLLRWVFWISIAISVTRWLRGRINV